MINDALSGILIRWIFIVRCANICHLLLNELQPPIKRHIHSDYYAEESRSRENVQNAERSTDVDTGHNPKCKDRRKEERQNDGDIFFINFFFIVMRRMVE